MNLDNVTIDFTEDDVIDMMLADNNDNFGGKGRAKEQAKRELKDKLRKEQGKDWWKPKNYIKMKRDFKLNKNKVQNEALAQLKADKKAANLEAKKNKWQAKKELGVKDGLSSIAENIGAVFGAKPNNAIAMAPAQDEDPKDNKKKIILFIVGGLMLIAGVFLLIKK